MDDPLRNAFVIEVRDFFTHDEVFEQRQAAFTGAQSVLIVGDLDAFIGRQGLLVASVRNVSSASTFALALLCDGVRATPPAGCFFVGIAETSWLNGYEVFIAISNRCTRKIRAADAHRTRIGCSLTETYALLCGDSAFSRVIFCSPMMRAMAAWFDVASSYIFARSAFSAVRDAPSRYTMCPDG